MTAMEQVLELKKRAVEILIAEREQIDAQLDQLGYGKENPAPMKKRGRPTKQLSISVPNDTIQAAFSSAPLGNASGNLHRFQPEA
jgi:hypothetical protein